MTFKVIDHKNEEITVGSNVNWGALNTPGIVTAISEPDVDHDDNIQGPAIFPPRVTVELSSIGENQCTTHLVEDEYEFRYGQYVDWQEAEYMCDELEVVTK